MMKKWWAAIICILAVSVLLTAAMAENTMTLPESLTAIEAEAFEGLTSVDQFDLPAGVTEIGAGAFRDSGNPSAELRYYFAPAGVSVGAGAFDNCRATIRLNGTELPRMTYTVGSGGVTITGMSGQPTEVVIPDTIGGKPVVAIGNNVFNGKSAMTRVVIPSTVVSIGQNAFRGCSALTGIDLPAGLTSLGSGAFRDCQALTAITIPAGITALPNETFYNCYALSEIDLPAGLTTLGNDVFFYCKALTAIDLPEGITSLPNETFYGCYALSDIDLTGITSLGNSVFRECRALTEVTIPEGITALPQSAFEEATGLQQVHLPSTLTTINNYAFYHCAALTEISIPAGVMAIPYGCFQNCTTLQSVQLPAGTESIAQNAFRNCTVLTGINFPAGLTSIGQEAFRDTCVGQAANAIYVLPDSVETFGSNAFYNCGAGLLVAKGSDREAFVKANGYTFAYDADDGFRYQYRKVSNVDTLYLTGYKGAGGNVTIPAGPVVIGESAFADNTAVTRVTIPNTVTTLDRNAFRYCTNLSRVTMADSVTDIGVSTFAYCAKLTDVTFSANLTTIDADAFDYACTAAGTHFYNLPDHIATLGWTPFSDCGAVPCFNRGSDTAALFRSNSNTSSILYTYAGETDFRYRWYNNEGTTGHVERLIQYTGNAQTVSIPAYVWLIDADAFRGNTAITKVVIPEGVTHIYANAFRDCANLTDITLPDTLYEVRDNVFSGCGSASAVDFTLELPASIEIVRPGAFTSERMILLCGLNTTTAERISNRGYAFVRADRADEPDLRYKWDYFDHVWGWGLYDYVGSLSSVRLPDDCANVNSAVLRQKVNNGLELVCGQLSDTAAGISRAEINFTFPGHEGIRYRIIENVLYVMGWTGTGTALNIPKATAYIDAGWDEQIRSAAFAGNETLAKAVIPEGVTRINADAFSGCVNLTDITLPDSLKSMDQKVFRYAGQNLSEPFYLVLPDHIEDLMGRNGGANSFEDLNAVLVCGKTSQTAALVSDRNYCYTVAGEYDFRYRYEIPTNYSSRELWLVGYEGDDAQVTIPSGIYGIRRFSGNTTSSNWPTFHGDGFYGNATVTKVVIPEGTVVLEDSAFRGCVNLTDISFPNTLKVIKNHAVQECGSASQTLHYYVLPDNMEEISTATANDWGAFNDINMGRVSCNPGTSTALQLSGIDTYNHNGSYLFALKGHETDGLLYQYRQYTVNGEPVNRLELRRYEGSAATVNIPAGTGLHRIENRVFEDHQELQQVTLPDGLVEIGEYAFSGCTLLHGGAEEFVIQVPGTVKRIQNNAFYEVGNGYTANRFYLVLPGALDEFDISVITKCNAVLVAPGGLAAQVLYDNWYYYYTTLADAKAGTNCQYRREYDAQGIEIPHAHNGRR